MIYKIIKPDETFFHYHEELWIAMSSFSFCEKLDQNGWYKCYKDNILLNNIFINNKIAIMWQWRKETGLYPQWCCSFDHINNNFEFFSSKEECEKLFKLKGFI